MIYSCLSSYIYIVKDEKSIQALVRLIEDPDENIFEHVRDELVTFGPSVIPFLETSWEEDDLGLLFQSRIENLIQEIQFNSTKNELKGWIENPHKDLLEGAIIIAKYQYPNLDEEKIRLSIQEIRKSIWLEINPNNTAFEKVRIFNKVFYGHYHFTGNSKNYHSPSNSFINTVLDTKKGNPLSLCLLYSIIAQSLDMPVYGVNLPNHFVLAYMDELNISSELSDEETFGVLFYINGFSKGGIFDKNEIKEFLKGLNIAESREFFEPCTNSAIIKRMLTNLITAFQQAGSAEKVNELTELRNLFDLKF